MTRSDLHRHPVVLAGGVPLTPGQALDHLREVICEYAAYALKQ